MDGKPMIRHCRNCEYAQAKPSALIHCIVKYKYYTIDKQRRVAIFCRYYKRRKPTLEFLNKRVNMPAKQKTVEEDRE